MKHRIYPQPVLIGCTRKPNGQPATIYPDPVRDAEAFCARYLEDAFQHWGMYLRDDDWEDSLQELIRHLLRLEQIFDPERNDSFANYARSIIPRRAVDAGPRRILGRTGNRLNDYQHDQLDETAPDHRPIDALTAEPGDQDPDRRQDHRRLQPHRDRQEAWAHTLLGLRAPLSAT